MLNAAEKVPIRVVGPDAGVERRADRGGEIRRPDLYRAQVQQDGSSLTGAGGSAMETLIDGRAQVSVSVTNVSGNSADASRVVTVDTLPPSIRSIT